MVCVLFVLKCIFVCSGSDVCLFLRSCRFVVFGIAVAVCACLLCAAFFVFLLFGFFVFVKMIVEENKMPLASFEPPYRVLILTLREVKKASDVEGMRAKVDVALREAERVCKSNFSQLYTKEQAEEELLKVVEERGSGKDSHT